MRSKKRQLTDSRGKRKKRLIIPRRMRRGRPLTLDASTKRDFFFFINEEAEEYASARTEHDEIIVSESSDSSDRAVFT